MYDTAQFVPQTSFRESLLITICKVGISFFFLKHCVLIYHSSTKYDQDKYRWGQNSKWLANAYLIHLGDFLDKWLIKGHRILQNIIGKHWMDLTLTARCLVHFTILSVLQFNNYSVVVFIFFKDGVLFSYSLFNKCFLFQVWLFYFCVRKQ